MSDSTEPIFDSTIKPFFPVLTQLCAQAANFWSIRSSKLCEFTTSIYNIIGRCKSTDSIHTCLGKSPSDPACQALAKSFSDYLGQLRGPTVARTELCMKLNEFCGLSSQMTAVSTIMLLNSVPAMVESAKIWYRLYNYKMESIQEDVKSIRKLLEDASSSFTDALAMKDENISQKLVELSNSQVKIAQQHLINTLKNVKREVEYMHRMKRDLRITTGVHTANTAISLFSWFYIPSFFFNSISTACTTATVGINSVFTVADIIAAGKIDEILKMLEEDLNCLKTLQIESEQTLAHLNEPIML